MAEIKQNLLNANSALFLSLICVKVCSKYVKGCLISLPSYFVDTLCHISANSIVYARSCIKSIIFLLIKFVTDTRQILFSTDLTIWVPFKQLYKMVTLLGFRWQSVLGLCRQAKHANTIDANTLPQHSARICWQIASIPLTFCLLRHRLSDPL